MEAAASGLPVVATDIRGCRQVVEPGVTGELVPVADAGALRGAIERYRDPGLRRAHGAAGRQKAEREFDERTVVARVLAAHDGSPRR
jgi:glycosyltransferase involved in cell wall biosynthesis